MKEGRRLGGVHAGPESKVLDGLSWEEVKNMQDAQTSQVDGYGGMKVNFFVFEQPVVLLQAKYCDPVLDMYGECHCQNNPVRPHPPYLKGPRGYAFPACRNEALR